MKKVGYLVCICAALVLGVCSCSKDGGVVYEKKVALILPSGTTVPRWVDDADYLTKALNSYGYQVKLYTAEETAAGAEEQVKQIEEALNSGFKHFVITPIDYVAINASGLLEAHKDCDFISYDRMIMENDAVDFYTSCDPEKIGIMQAQFLLQYFRAAGKETMSIEYFAGPETDKNAVIYFESACDLLAANRNLIVKSRKETYKDCALPSWSVEDAKAEMLKRLEANGEAPDLVLAPNDNVAEGIIEALAEKGYKKYPVITGQDYTDQAKRNILRGRQAMTIYKENEELASTAAMVVNSFVLGNPVKSEKSFYNGAKYVPVIYSSITLITEDNI